MNILSIGNSFSEDAQRYLHGIAKCAGTDLTTFNLYIGGCPLSRHYRNMLSGERQYTLQMNGESTGFPVSLSEGLLNRDWDVVTLQQASPKSPFYDSYQPYLSALAEYVRECAPKARIFIHQTWAYEDGFDRVGALGFNSRAEMFECVKSSYAKAAEDICADMIIPSGELLEALTATGVDRVHRDGFHAGKGLGRYAIALLWYAVLTGKDVESNSFSDFDEEITDEEIGIAKRCVRELTKKELL